MRKHEFLKEVAFRANLSKPAAELALQAVIFTIQDALKSDDAACKVPGMGTFKLVPTKARKGRNPSTGQPMDIPAGFRLKFTAAKGF